MLPMYIELARLSNPGIEFQLVLMVRFLILNALYIIKLSLSCSEAYIVCAKHVNDFAGAPRNSDRD